MVLRSLTAVVVLAASVGVCASFAAHGPAPNAVAVENRRPGTPAWLGPQTRDRSAEVYASQTDALPGDTVDLHVSATPAAEYRILVYRLGWYRGVGARRVACLPGCSTSKQADAQPMPPPASFGEIAGWPVTDELAIGRSWRSGYYQVRMLLLTGPEAGQSATTYVIVRAPQSRSTMLVEVPVNTWQAYNSWGGHSLYDLPGLGPRSQKASFNRPYAWFGPGGQGPLGWELPLVRFIERNGWDVSYQTDVYTDARPGSLLRHKLVVLAGHGEYWSKRMRDGSNAHATRGSTSRSWAPTTRTGKS